MCLKSYYYIPLVAKEDIICYKFYIRSLVNHERVTILSEGCTKFIEKDKFYSPYTLDEYEIKDGDTVIEILNKDIEIDYFKNADLYYINGGMIHCLSNDEIYNNVVVKEYHHYSDDRETLDIYLFKVVIPKGTLYFKDCINSQYCAKKIIVKEVVKIFTERND